MQIAQLQKIMARKPRKNSNFTKSSFDSGRSNQSLQDNLRSQRYEFGPEEASPITIDKSELRIGAIESKESADSRKDIVFFPKEKDKDYKELIINTEALERRVARIENGILQGFDVERLDEDRMVGAIFKGKVQNLEPGLKAAFVDIGQEKNAFLHYWDMLPGANNDPSIEIVRENKKRGSNNEVKSVKDIPKAFPIGSEIVVQITKAQIGSKGPRTTTNLSLPGGSSY